MFLFSLCVTLIRAVPKDSPYFERLFFALTNQPTMKGHKIFDMFEDSPILLYQASCCNWVVSFRLLSQAMVSFNVGPETSVLSGY